MTQTKSIQLPTIFNVASYFVDRHISEGRGQKIAYECGDERVSYRQLFERVNRAGNMLKKLGVRQEERIGMLLLDTPEFAYSFLARSRLARFPSRSIPCSSRRSMNTYSTIHGRGC